MKHLSVVPFILSVIFCACSKEQAGAGQQLPASIRVRNCAAIDSAGRFLQVCFDSVLVDGRCPYGATCVWEGVAEARFTLYDGQDRIPFTLFTGTANSLEYPDQVVINGMKIHFENLTPHPSIYARYDYSGYEAFLSISR